MVNEEYLKGQGFVKDMKCPDGVNRWEKSDGKTHFHSSYWVSVTLNDKGEKTLYGVINFHSTDGHGYITDHRSFDKVAISVEDFNKFLDRNCDDLPDFVKSTRKNREER